MLKDTLTMYVWGTPVTVSYDVYFWVMKGNTRDIRFKRANMVLNKRRKDGKYF